MSFPASVSAPQGAISDARRLVLFAVFCLAMFLDTFNLNALFAAIPALQEHFALTASEASWVISACQLTYASFLLVARALGIFGGVGGIGNVLGAIISGLFVQYASYRWVFWFVAIVALPSAIVCLVFIPDRHDGPGQSLSQREKLRNLDLVGALILFIFAVTSGPSDGWGTGQVITPLVISVLMVILFFLWKAHIPFERAAVPPRTWFLPNFAVLFGVSLVPYMWWNTAMSIFYPLWQDVFGWSVIKSAVHMVPIGIAALCVCFTGPLARWVSPKWLITFGNVLLIAGTVLFCFADSDAPGVYWRYAFPGLALGSAGAMFVYTHSNIAIFACSPGAMAGIVGAIFNCGCELGASVGLAVDTALEAGVELRHGGFRAFEGRRATFYWQIAVVALEAVAVLVFYRTGAPRNNDVAQAGKDVSGCGTMVEMDAGDKGLNGADEKGV
ncbi:uncharacterized protein PHACADRAFT_125786 [Phanerochaete carnosa HHB-10118-sp]|uniref:Major facilitator superfamily (MFS) profile domain-containing protein n=1 Tax=Phanerochaete carnosa (strain HHB-10118-sp) TaxID=650164 RepID=K5W3Z0_PHACS|nr:uncharacterized protein PHACADRAFT_125786 [Phanerochaete carnosa HHB-10118-sp]EKM53820.1 hypothetical protein PHACADRAFT_125786 [Phanerochaete carnosa HHB-10118-sp]